MEASVMPLHCVEVFLRYMWSVVFCPCHRHVASLAIEVFFFCNMHQGRRSTENGIGSMGAFSSSRHADAGFIVSPLFDIRSASPRMNNTELIFSIERI